VRTTAETSPDSLSETVHRTLDRFSLFTWHLACATLADAKRHGQQGGLITLVNDWQYLRPRTEPAAVSIRSDFYRRHKEPFPLFLEIMREYGLGGNDCLELAGWRPLLSESWLRRRIEKRLKKLARSEPEIYGLTTESCSENTPQIMFNDFGRACRLLVCGQADCAGEVMELIWLLHEAGCRQLISFVPEECLIPVNEGTRRAIALFRLADFTVVNVSLPCLGGMAGGGPTEGATVGLVSGQNVGDGGVDATVELHHCFEGTI
jgi:hypothetical protein